MLEFWVIVTEDIPRVEKVRIDWGKWGLFLGIEPKKPSEKVKETRSKLFSKLLLLSISSEGLKGLKLLFLSSSLKFETRVLVE